MSNQATQDKPKKKSVVFTKSMEVVALRRAPDNETGDRVDETVYIQLNRMDDLRSLRTSFVSRTGADVGQLIEIPNYPISDQLFLYLAEQMKLAQVVDLPDTVEAPEEETEVEHSVDS